MFLYLTSQTPGLVLEGKATARRAAGEVQGDEGRVSAGWAGAAHTAAGWMGDGWLGAVFGGDLDCAVLCCAARVV